MTAPDPDACAQPGATLALAFAGGCAIGLVWAASWVFYPYRLHRFNHPR